MNVASVLQQLVDWEQDSSGADITDLGNFLEACDYVRTDYPGDWTTVFTHPRWRRRWTFMMQKHSIPRRLVDRILQSVKEDLTADGYL
jgi:hypothetical protein